VLFKLNNYFDPIRKKNVILKPEELIRQALVDEMINSLGYPKEFLALEKDLKSICFHEGKKNLPNRRVDIVCFAKDIYPNILLYPLLVIECKAHLTKAAIDQLLGYNYYIKSFFITIADDKTIKTFWLNKKTYESIDFLPPYNQLLEAIDGNKKKD
jgi:hypothetical protein